jgi:hypothetical protein
MTKMAKVPKLPMWASWPPSIAFWLSFARQSLTRAYSQAVGRSDFFDRRRAR